MVFKLVEKKSRSALPSNTISVRKSYLGISADLTPSFEEGYVEYYFDDVTGDVALVPASKLGKGFKISDNAKAPNGMLYLITPSSLKAKLNFGTYQVRRDKKFLVLKGAYNLTA